MEQVWPLPEHRRVLPPQPELSPKILLHTVFRHPAGFTLAEEQNALLFQISVPESIFSGPRLISQNCALGSSWFLLSPYCMRGLFPENWFLVNISSTCSRNLPVTVLPFHSGWPLHYPNTLFSVSWPRSWDYAALREVCSMQCRKCWRGVNRSRCVCFSRKTACLLMLKMILEGVNLDLKVKFLNMLACSEFSDLVVRSGNLASFTKYIKMLLYRTRQLTERAGHWLSCVASFDHFPTFQWEWRAKTPTRGPSLVPTSRGSSEWAPWHTAARCWPVPRGCFW